MVASKPAMTMLARSQKPDRVSNILRSSTRTTRETGISSWVWAACSRMGAVAVAVMPLSFLVGCLR